VLHFDAKRNHRRFCVSKKAAAYANCDLGVLPIEKRDAIAAVCDEILAGKLEDEFQFGKLVQVPKAT
jgi:fumarate hydratase class II